MWDLSHLAEQAGQRPSEILGLGEDPWIAWDFDHAVFYFRQYMEAELDTVQLTASEQKRDDWKDRLKRKRRRKLDTLLGIEAEKTPVTVASLAAQGVPVVKSSRTDGLKGDEHAPD